MTPCKTCPHRVENAEVIYPVWGELPTLGKDVARVIGEPHACHYSLDDEGCETSESWPCAGWPEAKTPEAKNG